MSITHDLIFRFGHLECIKTLLHYNADLESRSYSGSTPLLEAVCNNQINSAILLISSGSVLDSQG